MASKNDSLDLKILAQVDGIDEVKALVAEAQVALDRVRLALQNITITMDVE